MFAFLIGNLGTIIISIILLAVIGGIIIKLVRDKRKGKCAGCDFGECPSRTNKCGNK